MLCGCIFLIAIIGFAIITKCKCEEGFTGSFAECRSRGFTTEFCVKTPAATWGVGTCLCENGSIGLQMPGFGGQCVCQHALANPIYR